MAGASQVTGEQIWLLLASPELSVEAKMRAKKWVIVGQSWPSGFLGFTAGLVGRSSSVADDLDAGHLCIQAVNELLIF